MQTLAALPNRSAFRQMFGVRLPRQNWLARPPEHWGGVTHRFAFQDVIDRIFISMKHGEKAEGEQGFAFIYLCRHAIELECKEFIWTFMDGATDRKNELEEGKPPHLPSVTKLRTGQAGHNLSTIGYYTSRALNLVHGPDSSTGIKWPRIQAKLDLWQVADPYGHVIRYGRDQQGRSYNIEHFLSVLPAYGLYVAITKWIGLAHDILDEMQAQAGYAAFQRWSSAAATGGSGRLERLVRVPIVEGRT